MCIHVNVFKYNSLVDVYEGWGCRRNGGGGVGLPELISIKRVVGRVRASRHYKVHPPPLHGKNRKGGLHGPFSLEKLGINYVHSPCSLDHQYDTIDSLSWLALTHFNIFAWQMTKFTLCIFFTVGLCVHNVILNIT